MFYAIVLVPRWVSGADDCQWRSSVSKFSWWFLRIHQNCVRWQCFLKTDHKTILNGRQSKVNVYLSLKKMKPSKVMSRNHAALHFREGRFYLEDTNSSNGTQVNNKQLPPFQVLLIKSILVWWVMFQFQPIEIFSGDVLEFGTEVG